ncbi:sugar ABC transporter permease [Planococcus sp. N028]|uniref:Sugar ABC transporter permease n=1 Tax=Planococcus shixiaomingii TaxID=3058393 RepID=A0ABT8N5G2_9BACL|nr:sugar ABC transporter permease [Planococcus sp. N028]MDN7242887.1 sugar ABC transporter permease [Planococcus sp. N028]
MGKGAAEMGKGEAYGKAPVIPRPRQAESKSKRGVKFKHFLPYLLISPLVIWILLTIFIPLSTVVRESFYSAGFVGTESEFVGLQNYTEVLASGAYWTSWKNSLIWVVGNGILQTVLAYSVALYLNKSSRISNTARTWMIIPWIIPTIVVAIFWQWIFNGSYGIMNAVLMNIGAIDQPLNLLGNPTWALPTIIFINSWHWFPFLTVLILAALAGIPEELYEASAVDGANKFQEFWHITLPSLQHISFALGLVGTLWMFNIFDIIYALTEGGPAGSTTTVSIQIYQEAFEHFEISSASAMSVVTALIMLVFAIVYIKFAAPKED